MKKNDINVKEFGKKVDQLFELDTKDLPKLPYPYEDWEDKPYPEVSEARKEANDLSLDGILNIG
ncbi:MAG: hypothetical protein GY863_16455, partial [bacterium]|nr:hypothetical protein [bacterium]